MYVPQDDNNTPKLPSLVEDLDRSRKDVAEICLNAPKCRDNNLITRLLYSTQLLKIHIKVLTEFNKEKHKIRFDSYYPPIISFGLLSSLSVLSLY